MEIEERVKQMEERLNRLLSFLEEGIITPEKLDEIKPDAEALIDYMETLWILDYIADSNGMIDRDFPRGVLSQDTLYDAVCDYDRVVRKFSAQLPPNRETD